MFSSQAKISLTNSLIYRVIFDRTYAVELLFDKNKE